MPDETLNSQQPETLSLLALRLMRLEQDVQRVNDDQRRTQGIVDDLRPLPQQLGEVRRIIERSEQKFDEFVKTRQNEEYTKQQLEQTKVSLEQQKASGRNQMTMTIIMAMIAGVSMLTSIVALLLRGH